MNGDSEERYTDVESFFRCLLSSQKSADARTMLGLIFFLRGQLQNAREQLQIALDQDTDLKLRPTLATLLLDHVQEMEKPHRMGNVIFLSALSFENY